MITSLDKITVNTPEEFFKAITDGYLITKITHTCSKEEIYAYISENKNVSHNHMYLYSHLLLIGYGADVDYKESLIYAKKASDYGNGIATRLVGYIYERGYGVEKDLNIAFEYYKRAVSLGNYSAYKKLASFYKNGCIVEKNLEKALEYFRIAEEHGALEAVVSQGNIYYDLKEYEKALSCYERAVEAGFEESRLRLAYLLSNENLLEPNYERAAHYYQLLAEKKNHSAMNNLAILYESGKGVEKNSKKAFELYKEATENGGRTIAFSNLASCYFYGTGTEVDYKKALDAALKSVEFGGDGKAFQILYRCYNEGLGTEKDTEKAKHYRDLALSFDDIHIVIEICLDYMREAIERFDKTASSTEAVNKLNKIAEGYTQREGFLESYLLSEINYCLYKIEPENWKKHLDNAMLYAKRVYAEGKELANHKTMRRMYGPDFFDFNTENDYLCYDEERFNGYTIGTTRVTYVPQLEAKANNYSIDYWLPRARLVYAMYCEIENKQSINRFYENAISAEPLAGAISYKNVIYPNALYMNASRHLAGYDTAIDEEYGTMLMRMAAERYHTLSAFFCGDFCQRKGNYEEALKYYRIALSRKYPEYVKRKESVPSLLLNPGEKIIYTTFYEYGGDKKVSYYAVEDIVENYGKYNSYIKLEEAKEIADLFFEIPYELKNPERFFKAFNNYCLCYSHFDKFVEKYAEEFISLETAVALINKNKTDIAINIFKKAIKNGDLEAVKNAKRVALDYRVYEGELEEIIRNRLSELGEVEEKKEIIEPVQVVEKASSNDEELRNHPIWSYLKFNIQNSIITELASLLYFPNKLSEKEICKKISKYFIPMTPIKITAKEVNEVLDYAKTSNMYFQCGILLLSFNCMEGLNLLTKHYINNIDCLLKLSNVAIMLYEKHPIVYSFPYSFNKAMCLLSKGDKKGNKILKAIVSLKGASKLEKCTVKPYQPAVDFLNGIEVNEEYLLNIRRING